MLRLVGVGLAFADFPQRDRTPITVSFQYDAKGNLTNDRTRVFSHDAENQLTNVFKSNAWRVGFVYDAFGLRRIRPAYGWQGGGWQPTNEIHYVCDGPLVIQERDANDNVLVTYTRGLDLSGSLQGAGGIGGLLARTDSNGTTYYHCDGNGNITALTDANGNMVARYEYDAYGRLIGMWGSQAAANVYRFSSKEYDAVTGLYYFGYRYYDAVLQRWLNQDPLGLGGGPNAYGFAANNPVMFFDPYGEYTGWEFLQITGAFAQGAGQGAQNVGNAAYNMVAGPSQLAGTLSTSYGQEQVADALASAVISGGNFVTDSCARQQDLNNLANQASAQLNNPDELSVALANVGVLAATAGLGEIAVSAEGTEAVAAAEDTVGEVSAATPIGRSGNPINVMAGANEPATINGIDYFGHALDQMQGRGFMPSVVENTLNTGTQLPGNLPGTSVFYDAVNNVKVVVNSSSGKIITVIPGKP
jgi:RHS repeat-associated protein